MSITAPVAPADRTGPSCDLLSVIRRDFRVLPQLALTVEQAGRLWAIAPDTGRQLLDSLVEEGFLTRRRDGRYGMPGRCPFASEAILVKPMTQTGSTVSESRRM